MEVRDGSRRRVAFMLADTSESVNLSSRRRARTPLRDPVHGRVAVSIRRLERRPVGTSAGSPRGIVGAPPPPASSFGAGVGLHAVPEYHPKAIARLSSGASQRPPSPCSPRMCVAARRGLVHSFPRRTVGIRCVQCDPRDAHGPGNYRQPSCTCTSNSGDAGRAGLGALRIHRRTRALLRPLRVGVNVLHRFPLLVRCARRPRARM